MPDRIKQFDARDLCLRAYERQMTGQLDEAVHMYKKSIELFPTAEAHTFLGWTYSFMGMFEEAIAECKKAIVLDPNFGNPYNDIGSYLIELGKDDEAIPYFEKALLAKKYETPSQPHFFLGRIYLKKGLLQQATEELHKALKEDPEHELAKEVLDQLEMQIQ